jgi:hypothetical protein
MWKSVLAATIGAALMLAPAFAAYAPKRIVTAIHGAEGTFDCHAEAGEPSRTYKTTSQTVFRTSDQKVRLRLLWHKGSLSDLKVGDVITVQYHVSGGAPVADRVAIYRKP